MQYRLKQIDLDGTVHCTDPVSVTTIASVPDNSPHEFSLFQNYPNPFNPATTIEYQLPNRGEVSILIYNSLGQLVRTLVAGEINEAGTHTVVWDGRSDGGNLVSSGAYFYQLRVNGQDRAITHPCTLTGQSPPFIKTLTQL